METKKFLTPAKINLYIEVLGKRQDGYHNICSLVDLINIYDEIEIVSAKKTKVVFYGPWHIPENNTVTKTIDILNSAFPGKIPSCFIKIHKNIPPGSGMGGASSDAAGILKVLNEYCALNLDEKELFDIGFSIGADVPLFLSGKRCVISGRGERVQPVTSLIQKLKYLIFVPDFQVSTKTVYEQLKIFKYQDLTTVETDIKILLHFWEQGNIENMEKYIFNRLEEVSISLTKEIGDVKVALESFYNKKFFLTGTGGALYSIVSKDSFVLGEDISSLNKWKKVVAESLTIKH